MSTSAAAGNPLGTDKISKLLVHFAVPSIISLVVNAIYNLVDQIYIGQGVGYLGNAATNIILPLVTFQIAIGIMLSDGTASYLSLKLGEGNEQKAAKGVANCITLMILYPAFCCACCLSCSWIPCAVCSAARQEPMHTRWNTAGLSSWASPLPWSIIPWPASFVQTAGRGIV